MRSKKAAATRQNRNLYRQPPGGHKKPFIAHIKELRKRIFLVALSIGVFGTIASFFQAGLTKILLSPAGNQQFIYTTPGGGFEFQFKLCLYAGLAASIPVLIYHLFTYIHPIFGHESKRFLKATVLASSCLAITGLLFGYLYGLPAAMHFLLQSFSSEQIKALISIQSYMSFILTYLLGAALLFQIPLILVLINRIKPLRPSTLFRQQRWVIVGAFILGAIISPTPDMRNQLVLSLPIIAMYQLGVSIIWYINFKKRKPRRVQKLLEADMRNQTLRQERFKQAQHEWDQLVQKMRSTSPSRG